MQKNTRNCPDDLENGAKIAMWDPLSDHSLDQSFGCDEDSKYLPTRTWAYEKQTISTVLFGFDENCSK